MKRNIKNEKVVRAISIGLAAMIAATSVPMNVYAEEGDPSGEPSGNNAYEDVENGVADDAQNKASDAKKDTNTASNAIPVIGLDGKQINPSEDLGDKTENISYENSEGENVTEENVNLGEALGEAVAETAVNEISTDISGATDDIAAAESQMLIIEGTADISANEAAVESAEGIVDGDISDASGAIADANTANENANNAETEINKMANTTNDKATDVNTKSSTAQNLANEAVKIINDANEAINGKEYAPGEEPAEAESSLQDQFDAAKTSNGMNAAYKKMVAIVDAAEADFNDKLVEYNTAKSDYDTAKAEYDELLKAYNEAYGEYETAAGNASDDFDAAKGKFDTANGKFESDKQDYEDAVASLNTQIDTLNGAIDTANTDAKTAAEELADAKEKLNKLKALADAAKAEVENSLTAGAQAIEEAKADFDEEKTEESKLNLFKTYVENFYVPETVGGSDAVVSTQAEEKYATTRHTYYKVTYKDAEGVEVTKYMNYSISDEGDVTLYEIPELMVKANEVLLEEQEKSGRTDLVTMTAGGKIYVMPKNMEIGDVFTDSNGNKILRSGLDNGSGYEYTYVINGEETTVNEIPTQFGTFETANDEGITVVQEISHGDVTFKWSKEDGAVVRTESTDVTTVTYHKNSLNGSDFATKEEAEAALKDAIDNLDKEDKAVDGDEIKGTVVSRETTEKYTEKETYSEEENKSENVEVAKYTASGEYVTSFEAKINLTADDWKLFTWIPGVFGDDVVEDMENSNASDIRSQANGIAINSVRTDIVGHEGERYYVLGKGSLDSINHDIDDSLISGFMYTAVESNANLNVTVAKVETETITKNDEWKNILENGYGYKEWPEWEIVSYHTEYDYFTVLGKKVQIPFSGHDVPDYDWVTHDNFADAVKNYYNAQDNMHYKSSLSIDGNTCTYDYVKKETVTGDTKTADASRDAAQQATNNENAKAAAKESLDAKTAGKTLVSNINYASSTENKNVEYTETVTKERDVEKERKITVWDYAVDYLDYQNKETSTKSNVTIYEDAARLFETHAASAGEHRNKLTDDKSDEKLEEFLNENDSLLTKYQKLSDDVETAQGYVNNAQKTVDDLMTELEELKSLKKTAENAKTKTIATWNLEKHEANVTELAEVVEVDSQALDNAKITLDELKGQLDDNEGRIKRKRRQEEADRREREREDDDYTLPDLADNESDETGDTTTDSGFAGGEVAGGLAGTIASIVPGAVMVAADMIAPVADVAGVRIDEMVAGDEEVAPADELVASSDEKVKTPKASKKAVKLEKDEVPLASAPEALAKENMNWWWLLLIALLGATGVTMYEKHKKKVAKAEAKKNNK